MIIEGEWRETSLAFIDFIKINYNEDPYDYLKCMGYEIPYINNLKCGILSVSYTHLTLPTNSRV